MAPKEDPVADFLAILQSEPGLLEEFLAGHEADNYWFWQRAWWWCHLKLFRIKSLLRRIS
jgi:hypothetical protein